MFCILLSRDDGTITIYGDNMNQEATIYSDYDEANEEALRLPGFGVIKAQVVFLQPVHY